MKVDPIKPTLKSPGTKRLKLNCDDLLLSLGFNFNLRRYNGDLQIGPAGCCPPRHQHLFDPPPCLEVTAIL